MGKIVVLSFYGQLTVKRDEKTPCQLARSQFGASANKLIPFLDGISLLNVLETGLYFYKMLVIYEKKCYPISDKYEFFCLFYVLFRETTILS